MGFALVAAHDIPVAQIHCAAGRLQFDSRDARNARGRFDHVKIANQAKACGPDSNLQGHVLRHGDIGVYRSVDRASQASRGAGGGQTDEVSPRPEFTLFIFTPSHYFGKTRDGDIVTPFGIRLHGRRAIPRFGVRSQLNI